MQLWGRINNGNYIQCYPIDKIYDFLYTNGV